MMGREGGVDVHPSREMAPSSAAKQAQCVFPLLSLLTDLVSV